jgi:phage FluMu protein Com
MLNNTKIQPLQLKITKQPSMIELIYDTDEKPINGSKMSSKVASTPLTDNLELPSSTKLSDYDLKASKSPDPSNFSSIEAQIKYELDKCFGYLQPHCKQTNSEVGKKEATTRTAKSSFTSIEKSKDTKLKAESKKMHYNYLLPKEAIELVNQREYTLISIDNEFFEKVTSKVIEIGISIYKPTYQKFALFPHFLNIHFIIREFINLRNGHFVPDSKMKNITGQSILISKNEIPKVMSLIFKSLGPKVCVVGHNVSSDIESFKYLNYQIPSQMLVIDTASLWYSLIGSKNVKSALTFILDKLNVPSAFLHNGANDAYYTLIVCLMLTSPELRNNLVFRKKITKSVIQESENQDKKPYLRPEIPDFSGLPPQEADIKMKRWLRKQKKAEEKSLKKEKIPINAFDTLKIRCSMDETTIASKGKSEKMSNIRKPKNPTANLFFKPVAYEESKLTAKLDELDV